MNRGLLSGFRPPPVDRGIIAMSSVILPADYSGATFGGTYDKISQGGVVPSVTFVVPPSGKVLLTLGCVNSGNINYGYGQAAAVEFASICDRSSSLIAYRQMPFPISGLTPGSTITYYFYVIGSSSGAPTVKGSGWGTVDMMVEALAA